MKGYENGCSLHKAIIVLHVLLYEVKRNLSYNYYENFLKYEAACFVPWLWALYYNWHYSV
jgi:hypothetical protein